MNYIVTAINDCLKVVVMDKLGNGDYACLVNEIKKSSKECMAIEFSCYESGDLDISQLDKVIFANFQDVRFSDHGIKNMDVLSQASNVSMLSNNSIWAKEDEEHDLVCFCNRMSGNWPNLKYLQTSFRPDIIDASFPNLIMYECHGYESLSDKYFMNMPSLKVLTLNETDVYVKKEVIFPSIELLLIEDSTINDSKNSWGKFFPNAIVKSLASAPGYDIIFSQYF